MNKITIDRRKTGFFSELANQINDNQENLKEYLQTPFSIEAFERQIELKKQNYSAAQRKLIHKALSEQMTPYFDYQKVRENVELIQYDNTFTITSGHQLNLFGGPLYVIYKIMDSVCLAEKLKEKYPEFNFVPVFWLATEDHDFEEINHLHLFNETFTWKTDQRGAVGRFNLSDFQKFKKDVISKFQNDSDFENFLEKHYSEGNLAQASTRFLADITGDFGVLILNADNKELKESFLDIIKKEIDTRFSEKAINETTLRLENQGYSGQALARPINLFYLHNNIRERIIPLENGCFDIGEKIISKAELSDILEKYPERFSPNVVLRPLYQEYILPNLCYTGGGGEMAYWLQLKKMFEVAEIPFPLIKVRNSIVWIDKMTYKRMEKFNLRVEDLFKPLHQVQKEFILDKSDEYLSFSKIDKISENYNSEIEQLIVSVDKGLEGYAKSEIAKLQKQLNGIKDKLIRHRKKKHETEIKQIESIFNKVFPNNSLQERYDNVLPFIAKFGIEEYIKKIRKLIDPFEKYLIIAIERGE